MKSGIKLFHSNCHFSPKSHCLMTPGYIFFPLIFFITLDSILSYVFINLSSLYHFYGPKKRRLRSLKLSSSSFSTLNRSINIFCFSEILIFWELKKNVLVSSKIKKISYLSQIKYFEAIYASAPHSTFSFFYFPNSAHQSFMSTLSRLIFSPHFLSVINYQALFITVCLKCQGTYVNLIFKEYISSTFKVNSYNNIWSSFSVKFFFI